MDFFNRIGKTISSTTQNVVRGTKDLTDIARLNSLISDEQKQIQGLYTQLGKLYYESSQSGKDNHEALSKLCHAIASAYDRIDKYNEEIHQIKGIRKCSNCGAEVPVSSVFCGACGTKVEEKPEDSEPQPQPEPKRFCTNCGTELSDGLLFCTTCGQKVE